MPDQNIALFLLGVVEIQKDDQPLYLDSLPEIALLSYSALESDTASGVALGRLLWPDAATAVAKQTLGETVDDLAACFGPELIQVLGDGLKISPGIWLDVDAFEAITLPDLEPSFDAVVDAQNAIFDLYLGPFLANWPMGIWPEFDVWVKQKRQGFHQLFRKTVDTIINTYRRANNWQQIAAVTRQALRVEAENNDLKQILVEAEMRMKNPYGR